MAKLIIAGEEVGPDFGDAFKTWNQTGWNSAFAGRITGRLDHGTLVAIPGVGANGANAKNTGLNRYSTRPALRRMPRPSLTATQAVIKKFVLHHDGVNSSEVCWNVLQNERGLSCHFLIDNDGTIYQTLDLALMGYHAAAYNTDSIGVEFCNRGILDNPDYYATAAVKHPISDDYFINGHKMKSFDFTEMQYQAFYNLAQVLAKYLPNLALEYPRDPQLPTKPAWGTLGPVSPTGDSYPASSFAGFCGHYHLTTRKWDPGPFDFKKWIDKLRGQRVFPVRVAGAKGGDKAVIPETPAELPAAIQPYYDASELSAKAGFFPVGPWGATRLWHGGVHLPAEADGPVYAPFAGRVIAARMGGSTDIGSNNFVLMRHDLNVASQAVRVYSLFMHLADESNSAEPPSWMSGESTDLDPEVGVKGYDEVLDAGAVIGRVGTVGPGDLEEPQLHFEIFSTQRWFEGKPGDDTPSPFTLIDGSAMGRFCDDETIDKLIDRDQDGRLSRTELAEFYDGSDDEVVRDLITLHVSEWAPEPEWAEELKSRPQQFTKKTPKTQKRRPRGADDDDEDLDIDKMVKDQLAPFTWWTDAVAKGLGLPASGTVYHYHPLRFIEYANAAHSNTKTNVTTTTVGIDDNEDVAGDFGYVPEPPPPPSDLHLKLENLVDGYEGDVPPP
ncbi:MAG: N-acetylmuramoyl-L-alanine amidase [Myxococcales bacterium]|nr:N-acetylmuramoyl-L-alanine amidase [Myxococcales bacterium]